LRESYGLDLRIIFICDPPDTHKCKGKRQSERQPFEVTSEKYREMIEKNRLAKMLKKKPKEART